MRSSPALVAALLVARSAGAAEDTRFGEIGHPGPDPGELTTPAPTVGVSASRVGHVTYSGLRVDVPTSPRLSLVPSAALLHIEPYAAGDPTVIVPYVGGGVAVRPARGWTAEASLLYGPLTHGIESQSALASVQHDFGVDEPTPRASVQVAFSWNRFRWASGDGPAGDTLTQLFLQAEASLRATDRLQISPRGMVFFYDHALSGAVGPRLGSISVLAQVGVYAPRWMGGGRVGYRVGRVLPFVDAQRIRYAEGVGDGTQLAGGLKVFLGESSSLMALGGVLWNQVHGPLVPTSVDLRRVPVIGAEVEIGF